MQKRPCLSWPSSSIIAEDSHETIGRKGQPVVYVAKAQKWMWICDVQEPGPWPWDPSPGGKR